MALPNFFCVGTQKAGTTTLYKILSQHPDIFLPPTKEAWFFHRDGKFAKGLVWYEATYFATCRNQHAVGEITPEYMYFETVPQRIYESLGPDVKLIFCLRNPVDRAYSHYLMTARRGRETMSFFDALAAEPERTASDFQSKIDFSYIGRGRYASQIQRFLDYFPKTNMLFLIFEKDIAMQIDRTVKRILAFLEVEEMALDAHGISNPASVPRFHLVNDIIRHPNVVRSFFRFAVPSKKIRSVVRNRINSWNKAPLKDKSIDGSLKQELLTTYFSEDIRQLEKVIGKDLGFWHENK